MPPRDLTATDPARPMPAWWLEDHPLTLSWDIWYACNYRCSYCWWEMDDLWAELSKRHRILSPEEWAAVWSRIHARYGTALIDLLGGEPMIYPRCGELLQALAQQHRFRITTNLSLKMDDLEKLLEGISPERVHFNVSFHPQFAVLEEFLEKVEKLREQGYQPGVLFVPWPPLLPKLAHYRAEFRKRGLPFTAMIFQGKWNGKDYPASYTQEERVLLADMMSDPSIKDSEVKYRLERQSPRGKLCHAGRIYANIKGNGDVYRCGQDAFGRRPMGNIFDPDFKLYEAPEPCPADSCSCLEFRYLDKGQQ